MAQRWEHSPPTNVARVQIPASTPCVGWVCCWFSPLPRRFFSGTPGFPLSSKLTFPNSNSTGNQVDKEPLCGCVTFKSLSIYLLRGYLIIFVFSMRFQLEKFVICFLMASIIVRFEEHPNKSDIAMFLCSLMSCVITVFSVTGWRKIRFKNGIHPFLSQVISVQ